MCKPTYPACLAYHSTYSKYFVNCLSRVRGEGTFWRGTNKRKQTYDRWRECQSPILMVAYHTLCFVTSTEMPGIHTSSLQVTPNLSKTASTPRVQSASMPPGTMQVEIANQTFQLSSPVLARILSPKTPKPGAQVVDGLLPLRQHDCMVDEQTFQDALEDAVAGFGILRWFGPVPHAMCQSVSRRS